MKIQIIRNQPVIMDSDLAQLLNIPVKSLNQMVKRNKAKYTDQDYFQLDPKEWQFSFCCFLIIRKIW